MTLNFRSASKFSFPELLHIRHDLKMSDSHSKMSEKGECSTSSVRIEDLFDTCRLDEKQNFYKILFYFPFGLLLLLIRLITGVFALFLLTLLPSTWYLRSIIFKGICKVFGLVFQIDDKYLDESAKLFVSNHASILDRVAINSLISCKTVNNDFQLKNVDTLAFWKDVDVVHSKDKFSDDNILTFRSYIEGSCMPLLSFPEGAMTNGRVGLLKFNQCLFSLNLPIQPVVIRVSISSFVNIPPSVIGSSAWSDILWLLFLPCTVFTLKVLPCMLKSPEETAKDFSKRAQQVMASALGLTPTVYTAKDKTEFKKRIRSAPTTASSSSASTKSSSTNATQHYSTLLVKTADSSSKESCETQFIPKFNTAAKHFGKSPKERMLSYQERKAILIESARVRYLQKQ